MSVTSGDKDLCTFTFTFAFTLSELRRGGESGRSTCIQFVRLEAKQHLRLSTELGCIRKLMSNSKCSNVGDIEQLLRTETLLVGIGEVLDTNLRRETGYLD